MKPITLVLYSTTGKRHEYHYWFKGSAIRLLSILKNQHQEVFERWYLYDRWKKPFRDSPCQYFDSGVTVKVDRVKHV